MKATILTILILAASNVAMPTINAFDANQTTHIHLVK